MRPTNRIATLRSHGFECRAALMQRVIVVHERQFFYRGKPAPQVGAKYQVAVYCPDRKQSIGEFSFANPTT